MKVKYPFLRNSEGFEDFLKKSKDSEAMLQNTGIFFKSYADMLEKLTNSKKINNKQSVLSIDGISENSFLDDILTPNEKVSFLILKQVCNKVNENTKLADDEYKYLKYNHDFFNGVVVKINDKLAKMDIESSKVDKLEEKTLINAFSTISREAPTSISFYSQQFDENGFNNYKEKNKNSDVNIEKAKLSYFTKFTISNEPDPGIKSLLLDDVEISYADNEARKAVSLIVYQEYQDLKIPAYQINLNDTNDKSTNSIPLEDAQEYHGLINYAFDKYIKQVEASASTQSLFAGNINEYDKRKAEEYLENMTAKAHNNTNKENQEKSKKMSREKA